MKKQGEHFTGLAITKATNKRSVFDTVCKVLFVLSVIAVIGLGVWGFILPPMGEIHQSVIQMAAIILAIVPMCLTPHCIKSVLEGKAAIALKKGDFEMNIRSKDHTN